MSLTSWKRFASVAVLAALGCGVQAGLAGAQGTMPPGSYTCQPLSEENFLQPPPFKPSGGMTPEEQEYADSMKLPPDLCPPGMIAYPVPIPGDIPHPGPPPKGSPLDVNTPADPGPRRAEAEKAKAKAKKAKKAKAKKAKTKKAKAKARRKKAKAKAERRRAARAKAASRR